MFRLLWNRLQTTIWFIPALLSLVALATALLLINADLHTDSSDWKWLEYFRIGTGGVRQVLAVTTGAMMTITGVVFSISVVTLTLAANQFGAKLLRNYLSDSRNKLVLGLFIGSFLYGLVVLASVDSEPGSSVPALAFMVSLALTMVAVAGLIYFIHNISVSIQADRLIATIGGNLQDTVARSLPDRHDSAATDLLREKWQPATHTESGVPAVADHSGYVEYINYEALLALTVRDRCALEIPVRPGDFVVEGTQVAVIFPLAGQDAPECAAVTRHISLGAQRTDVQDLEYSIMQLLQIALRALSPGVNDALTAIACIDWLSAALACMADRRFPPAYLADSDGTVRLKIRAFDFTGAVDAVFNPLRQNARGNEMVTIRLLEALAAIMQVCPDPCRLQALREHADAVYRTAEQHFTDAHDLDEASQRHAACAAAFRKQYRSAGGRLEG